MWVFDATPLIYLAKAEALSSLNALDTPRLVPERVYSEIVTDGLEHEDPDARRIERQVEDGTFDVVFVEKTALFDRLQANPNLSAADAAVLVLAAERHATAVMDECYGRDVTDTEGIPTRGTAYLLLSLIKQDAMTTDDTRETIDEMIEQGWYCAPNLYAQVIGKLDTL